MNEAQFKAATSRAERAVEHMPAGELKAVAFRVALERFLDDDVPARTKKREHVFANKAVGAGPGTLCGRILSLKDDGFFAAQQGLSEVRDELGSHGWHYPLTTLSGVMQRLVQTRDLRRVRATEGNKKVWKYSNP